MYANGHPNPCLVANKAQLEWFMFNDSNCAQLQLGLIVGAHTLCEFEFLNVCTIDIFLWFSQWFENFDTNMCTYLHCRYEAEMKMLADAAAEAKRKHDEWYANLGYSELSLKSAYKIQKMWRGYLVRRVWGKVLQKLKKKRLKAAKKGKKK